MARIAGVDLPKDKRIEIGLTYVYGIGRKRPSCVSASTTTTSWKATCAVRPRSTSSA